MKVAIVHYWFVNWRGGEKVVEAILEIFPNADVYTHVFDAAACEIPFDGIQVNETFISRLPKAKKWYQNYLPLMPIALEQLDLRGYDLVISSESGPAKGVVTDPDALHVCYCHSPMRYIWDMYPDYLGNVGWFSRLLLRPIVHYLKIWDRLSADRVDHFIANSRFVARRIQKFYRRPATVINPPIDLTEFELQSEKDDYYLVLGQLTHYKRADLVVDAFLENQKRLVVIGDGEQFESLKKKANRNIHVLGRLPWEECKYHLMNAKALIFPGVEDFGMVPVEAMACGTPVLAYAKGGALETVVPGTSGFLFESQTVDGINECIAEFELSRQLDPVVLREHAQLFSKESFKENFQKLVRDLI